jgi:hypothetical protein
LQSRTLSKQSGVLGLHRAENGSKSGDFFIVPRTLVVVSSELGRQLGNGGLEVLWGLGVRTQKIANVGCFV